MVVTRYTPVLVTVHWITSILIIIALLMGSVILSDLPNSDPEKLIGLKAHMIAGMIILVLTVIRLIIRLTCKKPPHSPTGNALLDKASVAVHYLFYIIVILMAASGIGTSVLAGLPDIVFNASGVPLPEDLSVFPPRVAHGFLAIILTALIVAHALGALYHQFILRDKLFSKMWFGKRN